MDTFGPITDNAGGIVEMSQAPEDVRQKTDRLDAVGNTTKALTKGYAIGSAALAAFLLFTAYLDEVKKFTGTAIQVDIGKVPVFVGGLLGATLVFVFSAFAIRAVGRAAYYVINEVRRQFKADPGIMQGTVEARLRPVRRHRGRGSSQGDDPPGPPPRRRPRRRRPLFKHLPFADAMTGAEAVAALLMVGTIAGILLATVHE